MLNRIHIENFKSLKDVTLDLKQVNLLIGANNSGKSNFLKAVQFIRDNFIFKSFDQIDDFLNFSFKHEESEVLFRINIFDHNHQSKFFLAKEMGFKKIKIEYSFDDIKYENLQEPQNKILADSSKKADYFLKSSQIYIPNPLTLIHPEAISNSSYLLSDVSNIIPFLETMRDEYRENFIKIEEDLRKCIPEFNDIRFKTIKSPQNDNRTFKKWGLFSSINQLTYWADELSEGVLYFLAILCIIHQPDPPKLLLLEEPERGIHPRRISEVLDFIFNLAYEKEIQVIMTTHNERVLNYFEDIPESVFVFDKDEEGATQVKNLKNIIEESDKEMEEKGLPKIRFTESLGEHWVTGFIGGVPKSMF